MQFLTPLRHGANAPVSGINFTFYAPVYYFPLVYLGIWIISGTYFFAVSAQRMDLFKRATFQTSPFNTLNICIL
jgi:hypothetical protein